MCFHKKGKPLYSHLMTMCPLKWNAPIAAEGMTT
jgi:hypothetical protein